MKSRLPTLYQMNRDEVVKKKNGVVSTRFAAHTFDKVFARVANHPRLPNPRRRLPRRVPTSRSLSTAARRTAFSG